jgi:hypothetical protein
MNDLEKVQRIIDKALADVAALQHKGIQVTVTVEAERLSGPVPADHRRQEFHYAGRLLGTKE